MTTLYDQFLRRTDLNIHKWHHYFPIYETHFSKFRGKPCRMLEIGVQGGGSAKLFRDWLGDQSQITGLDIDERCRAIGKEDRIAIEIGDQADVTFLEQVIRRHGPWDIVLDDGGHTANQVLTSFDCLFPSLTEGGVYLIEDTHSFFMGGHFLDHPQGKTIVDFISEHFANMHNWTSRGDLFENWHKPPPDRSAQPEPAHTVRHISAMHLYDSIVVIDKHYRPEPFSELRAAGRLRSTDFRFAED